MNWAPVTITISLKEMAEEDLREARLEKWCEDEGRVYRSPLWRFIMRRERERLHWVRYEFPKTIAGVLRGHDEDTGASEVGCDDDVQRGDGGGVSA